MLRGVAPGFFGSCLPQVSPYGFARSPSAVREHVPLPDLQPDAPLHGGLYCRTPVGAVPGAARLRLQQAVLPGDSLPQGQRQGTERLSFGHLCWLCSRLLGRFGGFPRSWCLPCTAAERRWARAGVLSAALSLSSPCRFICSLSLLAVAIPNIWAPVWSEQVTAVGSILPQQALRSSWGDGKPRHEGTR